MEHYKRGYKAGYSNGYITGIKTGIKKGYNKSSYEFKKMIQEKIDKIEYMKLEFKQYINEDSNLSDFWSDEIQKLIIQEKILKSIQEEL